MNMRDFNKILDEQSQSNENSFEYKTNDFFLFQNSILIPIKYYVIT